MVRTQIYLTREEREALRRLAEERGTTQSALIREAVDHMLERRRYWKSTLRDTKGMWADRHDLPDFRKLRREWDRHAPKTPDGDG